MADNGSRYAEEFERLGDESDGTVIRAIRIRVRDAGGKEWTFSLPVEGRMAYPAGEPRDPFNPRPIEDVLDGVNEEGVGVISIHAITD